VYERLCQVARVAVLSRVGRRILFLWLGMLDVIEQVMEEMGQVGINEE
jgi:hypothetical protein